MTDPRTFSPRRAPLGWSVPFALQGQARPWRFDQLQAAAVNAQSQPGMGAQLPLLLRDPFLDPAWEAASLTRNADPAGATEPHIYDETVPGGTTESALTQGAYRDEKDPARRGLDATVSRMLSGGRSRKEIAAYISGRGVDLSTISGLDRAFDWRDDHPGYRGNYTVDLEMRRVPMTAGAANLNRLLQSPVGTAAASSADKMSIVGLDKFSRNPEQTRLALNQLQNEHPLASALGTVTGGAAQALTLEAGLAAAGVPASMGIAGFAAPARSLLAEGLGGGAEGWASAPDGQGLQGALSGAGKSMLLGQAVRPASNALEAGIAAKMGRSLAKPLTAVTTSALDTALGRFTVASPARSGDVRLDPVKLDPIKGVNMPELYDLLGGQIQGHPVSPLQPWRANR